jgi:hypothetical protein
MAFGDNCQEAGRTLAFEKWTAEPPLSEAMRSSQIFEFILISHHRKEDKHRLPGSIRKFHVVIRDNRQTTERRRLFKKWVIALSYIPSLKKSGMNGSEGQIPEIQARPVQCFPFSAFVTGLRKRRGTNVDNPTKWAG